MPPKKGLKLLLMAKCKGKTKAGQPCGAEAQTGADFCFFHDPTQAQARHESKVKGGQTGKLATLATVKPWRGVEGEVEVMKNPSTADLVNLLADSIDDVRTGAIDPKVANAVGYLAGVMVKILQYEALDERLAAIEEALGKK